jgi:hypothetical protein
VLAVILTATVNWLWVRGRATMAPEDAHEHR